MMALWHVCWDSERVFVALLGFFLEGKDITGVDFCEMSQGTWLNFRYGFFYAVETFRVTNVILDFDTCLHAGLVAGFPRI